MRWVLWIVAGLAVIVLIVAVVPNDSAAASGSSAPDPSTSQALSAAAAITGSPGGSPSAEAADAYRRARDAASPGEADIRAAAEKALAALGP